MTAKSKVTITLGRSRGQVVKNGVGSSGEMQFSGVKRPVRERLGVLNNKRKKTRNGSNLADGVLGNGTEYFPNQQIDNNDLRLKLIKKGLPPKPASDGIDLREKLLRKSLKSTKSTRERERAREREMEREMGRERDRGREMERERDREREADARRRLVSAREREMEMEIPSSYSSYRHNEMRVDELRTSSLKGYLDLSSNNNMRPSSSSYNNVLKSDLINGPNPVRKSIHTTLVPPPLPRVNPSEVHLSVDELLASLGLEKYKIILKAEEVDMSALRQMGDKDLKELGIPMGPRKKILLAVSSNAKQRPTR